jgi:ABC-2 type transport system permease protein
MRSILSLVRREFLAAFVSPVAYVVLVVFLLLSGLLFLLTMRLLTASGPQGVEYPMQVMKLWLVFLFLPPVLTMRLFAEERASGTLEVLLTAPLRDWQIVASKFLATYAFFLVLLIPTAVYLPVLMNLAIVSGPTWTPPTMTFSAGLGALILGVPLGVLASKAFFRSVAWLLVVGGLAAAITGGVLAYQERGEQLKVPAPESLELPAGTEMALPSWNPLPVTVYPGIDPMPVAVSYLGLALAGAMFLAIGLFVSSLVRSQIVAFLVSLAVSLLFMLDFVIDLVSAAFGLGATGSAIVPTYFSVPVHFTRDFARGVLDTRPLVLYLSVTLFCLFLTVRSLETQRWR